MVGAAASLCSVLPHTSQVTLLPSALSRALACSLALKLGSRSLAAKLDASSISSAYLQRWKPACVPSSARRHVLACVRAAGADGRQRVWQSATGGRGVLSVCQATARASARRAAAAHASCSGPPTPMLGTLLMRGLVSLCSKPRVALAGSSRAAVARNARLRHTCCHNQATSTACLSGGCVQPAA